MCSSRPFPVRIRCRPLVSVWAAQVESSRSEHRDTIAVVRTILVVDSMECALACAVWREPIAALVEECHPATELQDGTAAMTKEFLDALRRLSVQLESLELRVRLIAIRLREAERRLAQGGSDTVGPTHRSGNDGGHTLAAESQSR